MKLKCLFINGQASEFIFDCYTTNENIRTWVETNIFMGINLFGLNEEHSCTIDLINDNTILICGDEDYKEFFIHFIETIQIS